jgi:hypothetical protein
LIATGRLRHEKAIGKPGEKHPPGSRSDLGRSFVREVDGDAVSCWYENLTTVRDLSPGTSVRHFNVMHHMMEKASTIWS